MNCEKRRLHERIMRDLTANDIEIRAMLERLDRIEQHIGLQADSLTSNASGKEGTK